MNKPHTEPNIILPAMKSVCKVFIWYEENLCALVIKENVRTTVDSCSPQQFIEKLANKTHKVSYPQEWIDIAQQFLFNKQFDKEFVKELSE